MNENVCRKCRRFAGRASTEFFKEGTWLCASTLYDEPSTVIPGHLFFHKQDLHPIRKDRKEPPDWCERPLEQVVLKPDEAVAFAADSNVVFNGNKLAEMKLRDRNVGSRV